MSQEESDTASLSANPKQSDYRTSRDYALEYISNLANELAHIAFDAGFELICYILKEAQSEADRTLIPR
jgi:hypothetical protein